MRSPIAGYPADGLNPQRLASILREPDQGDPLRYLELAETSSERDLLLSRRFWAPGAARSPNSTFSRGSASDAPLDGRIAEHGSATGC